MDEVFVWTTQKLGTTLVITLSILVTDAKTMFISGKW